MANSKSAAQPRIVASERFGSEKSFWERGRVTSIENKNYTHTHRSSSFETKRPTQTNYNLFNLNWPSNYLRMEDLNGPIEIGEAVAIKRMAHNGSLE